MCPKMSRAKDLILNEFFNLFLTKYKIDLLNDGEGYRNNRSEIDGKRLSNEQSVVICLL